MTLPTTGPISFDDLRTEFEAPGSRSIQDFYRGGAIVPSTRGASVNTVVGEKPVQLTPYSGTRSNVVTSGVTERITIGFNDGFDAGFNQADTQISLGNLGSVTQSGNYSWPTGTATPTVTGGGSTADWAYTAGGGGSGSTSGAVAGSLVYSGTPSLDVGNGSIAAEINVTALNGSSGEARLSLWVSNGSATLGLQSIDVTDTGTVTFTEPLEGLTSGTSTVVNSGDSLEIHIFSNDANDRPFTYEVVSVTVNTGVISTAHYDFDIDTSDTHIAGNVTGNFPATAISGQLAAQHLHDEIEATYSGVTASDPVPVAGVNGVLDIDFTNVATDGAFNSNFLLGDWFTGTTPLSTWTGLTTPSEFVDEFLTRTGAATLRSDITIQRGTGIGGSFAADAGGLVVRMASTGGGFLFYMGTNSAGTQWSFFNAWTTLPTFYSNGTDLEVVDSDPTTTFGVYSQYTITIDTGIQNDVADAMLVITANSGSLTQPSTFQVFNGTAPTPGNVHSTYRAIDPAATEITMFTSSVENTSESDVETVMDTIATAITNNVETPINFNGLNETANSELAMTGTTNVAQVLNPENMIVSLRFTPTATGTIGLTITGLTDTATGLTTRTYTSPILSYTSLSNLIAELSQDVNMDSQLLLEGAVDGTEVVLVIRSAAEFWNGDITLNGQTVSMVAVDYTQGGNLTTASGATISGQSGHGPTVSNGLWSFTVDHGAGDGNIAIGTSIINDVGARPITGFMLGDPINEDVPSTGPISLQDFYGATRY